MSRQTTLYRNMETGRIEMANANQPFNYDEDLSEGSMSGDEVESKRHVIYSTTNMLTPASQPINEIEVNELNED
jgi:hypothetical protein